ncbi:oxygen-independent coproporphyrinogen III oxidase [Meridianimarinicoccus roseus]|uniref:Coproporphyrinogen-III oxidase n=1 Tax=Meridianimarinicoccus roseus TaxID=2072018 RepID=A0A2V2LIF3_9RHOB|nr:oxygen-independent coproporphyrinogen III oxidase [Meridianimarinicoccus roseus]PWR03344.1 oxygen-independent coproporphyrinogen III oxidase [Meridianimarinicoccus roseus]
MEHTEALKALGLFNTRVPRYTSYPTAAVFTPDTGASFQSRALETLDPRDPVSVYVHIPFCERLCWFCACHTQGTKTLSPVESYIETLEAELELVRTRLPDGLKMGNLHWGGGTPTILPPEMTHRLARAIYRVFPPTDALEFSVEIDPTMVDREKIDALASEGMSRASIGIQDFDPEVQKAIGRLQPFDVTQVCVSDLRAAGINSLNTDLVYGLPHQNLERIDDTIDKVLTFAPDRVALFGYAHVPWVSKRQKLIDEDALPGDLSRYNLSRRAGARFVEAGLTAIGIDHFSGPEDNLTKALHAGLLRRNFQGYTADSCQTLIGLGASSISRFPDGYVQNAPATAAYKQRIAEGVFPGSRGYQMTDEDHLRARAIEHLMCTFALDLDDLHREFGPCAVTLLPILKEMTTRFTPFTKLAGKRIEIAPEGRALTRVIASDLDQHVPEGVRYSRAC